VHARACEYAHILDRYLRFAKGKDVQAHSKEDVQTVLGHKSKRRKTAVDCDETASKTVQHESEQTNVVNVTNYYEQQMRDKLAKLRDKMPKQP
jgi:hypothetical protein